MSSLHSLHAELGPGGLWVHWGLFSRTLNEVLSPKNEFKNIAKNSKVHPGCTLFRKKNSKLPNDIPTRMIFQSCCHSGAGEGMSRWKKLRKKGKREIRGKSSRGWFIGVAGQGAPCSVLKVPQDGSISECSRSTQGLPLRELAWFGVQSEALPPLRSGGLRVPTGMLPSSARGWREAPRAERPGSPW